MSVRIGERENTDLKYVSDAYALAQHSFNLCNNPNHFPEPVLANYIKEEVLAILRVVRYLLAQYTYDKTNKGQLFRHQVDALSHIDALYALLNLALDDSTYDISYESMEYWTGLVVNLEDDLQNLGSVSICNN